MISLQLLCLFPPAVTYYNFRVNIQVRRLGGSYGAKATRAALVAAACAVGAHVTNRPVRLILDLETNMEMIGKRLPYSGKYEVRPI
jgi:xanthine dehydrogenase molybdopterin-binding subunit B